LEIGARHWYQVGKSFSINFTPLIIPRLIK
jgi:hypothetical protein